MAAETTLLDSVLAERERVLRLLRAHASKIRDCGVTRLRLFGSTARGDAGPKSTSELLAHIDPRATLTVVGVEPFPAVYPRALRQFRPMCSG